MGVATLDLKEEIPGEGERLRACSQEASQRGKTALPVLEVLER
jgi:hypothetical protein